jgi:hypothetical protein
MGMDRLLLQLDEVEAARDALAQELQQLGAALSTTRAMRATGSAASEILEHGPGVEARRRVRRRVLALNEAMHSYRAQLIRSLVDEEGWSIARVARATRNARQVVSRLYHAAG